MTDNTPAMKWALDTLNGVEPDPGDARAAAELLLSLHKALRPARQSDPLNLREALGVKPRRASLFDATKIDTSHPVFTPVMQHYAPDECEYLGFSGVISYASLIKEVGEILYCNERTASRIVKELKDEAIKTAQALAALAGFGNDDE